MSVPARRKVISIIGTTGVGKSQLSIEVARLFGGEVINADSMQMYVGLDQITNKHPMNERANIPHHVMNHVKWDEQYYIHRFRRECEAAMESCWARGKVPVLVGGTHYYLQSVLFDNKTVGTHEQEEAGGESDGCELTAEQQKMLDADPAVVFAELKRVDPIIAEKFHPKDIRRVRRALEVCYVRGGRASDIYAAQRRAVAEGGSCLKYDTLFMWVYSKSGVLNERLDQRVDKMMMNGGLRELCELYDAYKTGACDDSGVWQVIGFKEFLPYLEKYGTARLLAVDGDENGVRELLSDKEFNACCEEMKVKTRKYAKKQVKWIKNLLAPELAAEEVKFGKMYVFDATDLNNWDVNVKDRGGEVVGGFLGEREIQVNEVPEGLASEDLIKDGKSSLDKTENWKHHVCDVCTDKENGEALVYVGEQWAIHLKSKKHRNSLNRGKRKREYEEWLKNKKTESGV